MNDGCKFRDEMVRHKIVRKLSKGQTPPKQYIFNTTNAIKTFVIGYEASDWKDFSDERWKQILSVKELIL